VQPPGAENAEWEATVPAHRHGSVVIDTPLATVFQCFVIYHFRNHHRMEPDIGREQLSAHPIGLGTLLKRVNWCSGAPVEGTEEVVEFEPSRGLGLLIHGGPVE
jgi:hypothetical protein